MEKCQICGCNDAQIDIQGIVNGKETSLKLCAACAEKNGVSPTSLDALSLAAFLERCLELGDGDGQDIDVADLTEECPHCGATRRDVEESGLVGCEYCYAAFKDLLDPSFTLDPADTGTIPERRETPQQVIRRLERRLKDVVEQEAYEEAAELRDQIRELEAELSCPASENAES